MNIKVMRIGQGACEVQVPDGTNVESAVRQAGFPLDGHNFSVNGLGASRSTQLNDGDMISVVPKVEGGN